MVDTRITLLVKDGEQMYILFSPSRNRIVKEIRVNGKVEGGQSVTVHNDPSTVADAIHQINNPEG